MGIKNQIPSQIYAYLILQQLEGRFLPSSLVLDFSLSLPLHKRGHWGEKRGLEGPIHFIIAEMT